MRRLIRKLLTYQPALGDIPDRDEPPGNAADLHPAPLTFLSLQHCPRGITPRVPTAEERYRAYRALGPLPDWPPSPRASR